MTVRLPARLSACLPTRLVLLLPALLLATGTMTASADDPGQPPLIRVSGSASIGEPPDRVVIEAGVVTTGDDADSALAANNEQLAAVRAALSAHGIADEDVSTVAFSVQPRFSPRPRNADEGWTPRIVGYTVEHVLAIRSSRLDGAGRLLSAVGSAGANRMGGLRFELADSAGLRARAIAQATRSALADARAAAEAAGGRLGEVRRIDVQDAPMPIRLRARAAMMEAADASGPVPIASGLVNVEAQVSVEVVLDPR